MRVIVWSRSSGVQLMARVALGPTTTVAVQDLAQFKTALAQSPADAVVVHADELARAGLSPADCQRLVPGAVLVLLSYSPMGPLPRGVRMLLVPFTARDLVASIKPDTSNVVAQPSPAPATELVRAEVERLVSQIAREVVEEVARRVVPELAEAMIQRELERLMREAADDAVKDLGPE